MSGVKQFPLDWYLATTGSFALRTFSLNSQSLLAPRRSGSVVYQAWVVNLEFGADACATVYQQKEAFFAALDGDTGLFRIGDQARRDLAFNVINPGTQQPWSDGTMWSDGTGWVEGQIPPFAEVDTSADRGSEIITLRGLPPSLAGAFTRGDLIEIRPSGIASETGNLYMVTVGGGTDADGRITVSVRPRLRQNFAPGDMAVLRDAMTTVMLADSEQAIMERAGMTGSFGFSAVEHLFARSS